MFSEPESESESQQTGLPDLALGLTISDLLTWLHKNNAQIRDGRLYIDTLNIKVRNTAIIESYKELVLLSGRKRIKTAAFNSNHQYESVHINPDLDYQEQPVHRHIPFSQLRYRGPVKRPRHKKGCQCCGS